MAITFTLHQTRQDFTDNGEAFYRIDNTIVSAVGIPSAVFLIEKGDTEADDTFARVCTPADLAAYTADRATSSGKYYRAEAASKTLPTVSLALGYADHVKGRLELLKAEYTAVVEDFRVTDEETII